MHTAAHDVELPTIAMHYTTEDGMRRTLTADPEHDEYPMQLALTAWTLATAPEGATVQWLDDSPHALCAFDVELLLLNLHTVAPGVLDALPGVMRYGAPLPNGSQPYHFDKAAFARLPLATLVEAVVKHVPPLQALEIYGTLRGAFGEGATKDYL